MNSFTKLAVFALAFAGISMASAETFNMADQKFFWKNKGLTTDGTKFTTKGMTFLVAQKKFDIDPAKKYSFKMTLNSAVPKSTRLYIGFSLFAANGRGHQALAWQGLPATFTQLTRDAKKGDKVIYVKKGGYWSLAGSVYIALDAKQDASDIPNTKIVLSSVQSKKNLGEEWEMTLRAPLKVDIPAGKNVRQHVAGGYFYALIKDIKPTDKEIVLTGAVQGYAKVLGGFNGKQWPIGAKKAQFIILADWGTKVGSPLTFKDATFVIE